MPERRTCLNCQKLRDFRLVLMWHTHYPSYSILSRRILWYLTEIFMRIILLYENTAEGLSVRRRVNGKRNVAWFTFIKLYAPFRNRSNVIWLDALEDFLLLNLYPGVLDKNHQFHRNNWLNNINIMVE